MSQKSSPVVNPSRTKRKNVTGNNTVQKNQTAYQKNGKIAAQLEDDVVMRPKMKYRTRKSIKHRNKNAASNEKIGTEVTNNDQMPTKLKKSDFSQEKSNTYSSADSHSPNGFGNNKTYLNKYDSHIKYITRQNV